MQFQVPQFLDVEDKVIGPFTIKQFLYLGGGLGMAYLSYRFIPLVGPIIAMGALALGWALAYYKFNGKPFVDAIEAAFNYMTETHLYIWKRRERKEELALDLSNFKPVKHTGALSSQHTSSKLSSLSWSVGMQNNTEEDERS